MYNRRRNARRAPSRRWTVALLATLIVLIGACGFALLKRNIAEPVAAAETSDDWDFGEWQADSEAWDEDWSDGWDDELGAFAADDAGDFESAANAAFADDDSDWNEDGLLGGLLSAEDESLVVAEFDGGTLTLGELAEPFNDRIAGSALLFGQEDEAALLEQVMKQLIADKLCRAKAETLGLTTLTDEDNAEIARLAKEAYESYDPILRDAQGVTLESIQASVAEDYWRTRLIEAATSDVTVTEAEIAAAYDQMVAQQREDFEAYPDDYEYALQRGSTIAYNLPGYRRVKHILFAFDDADTAARVEEAYDVIAEAQGEGADVDTLLTMQAALDALYVSLDAEAAEALSKLDGGADFDQLIEEYGDDPNMLVEPWKTNGYSVSADSTYLYSQDFIDACMSLETPGQVSVPAHSIGGTHIIRYLGDTVAGAVPLETIREAIAAELISEKRDQAFAVLTDQWYEAANVRLFPERVQG